MAAATDREQELKRYLDEAFKAFEAGQDERARRLCRQALALDPDSSTAHSLMGLLYEREGRVQEATTEFQQVVTVNPESGVERDTLRRLRGDETLDTEAAVFYDEAEDREAQRRTYLYAGIGAVCVALVVLLGFVAYSRLNSGNHGTRSASVQADLALAQQAYERARYDEAMEASQRVLNADPANVLAKQIYERSKARLGTGNQPVPPGGTTPFAGTPGAAPGTMQSQPALPQAGATNGLASNTTGGGGGGGAVGGVQPGFGVPAPNLAGGVVPPAPVGGGYAPGAAITGGQPGFGLRPANTPFTGRLQDAQRFEANTPRSPMRAPLPQNGPGGFWNDRGAQTGVDTRPDPAAGGRPSDAPKADPNNGINLEVHYRTPRTSATTGGDVKPRDSDNTPPPVGAAPVDPNAQRAQDTQAKLREQRERRSN